MEEHSLFSQYEKEYCNKSTEIAKKIENLNSLKGGKLSLC